MRDFAFIICQEQDELNTHQSRIIRYITTKLKGVIKKQKLKEQSIKTELYDNVNMHLIELPYDKQTLESFSKNKLNKILTMLHEIVAEESINTCILCKDISEICEGKVASTFTGRSLYKSLINSIIEEVYSNRGYMVSELDITIVHGNNIEGLNTIISLLSPYVKYLTVLTVDEEIVIAQAERVYEDTGLAVRVTGDGASAVKNADLIINLSDSRELISSPVVRKGAVIINYGDIDCTKILNNSTLINGIEVKFPQKIISRIDKKIFKHISTQGLAEIILNHKAENEDAITREYLGSEFKKCGYTIGGFVGRHNIITTREIKLK